MKQKIILAGAILLLLAVVGFMTWDIFFSKPDNSGNPYAYDMASLRSGDTSKVMFREVLNFDPGFSPLHGIATDRIDRIYVCGENQVAVFDQAGKRLSGFPVAGTALCIDVDEAGKIYLGMQDHVEIYTPSGTLLKRWESAGERSVITSVAVSGNAVFTADAGDKIVCRYDLEGNLVKQIGEKDPARGIPGFVVPSPYFDLGTDKQGKLWVVNPGRHKFEQYSEEGDLATSWGLSAMTVDGFCGCCNPSNFAFLSDGSFVTSEKGIERIKVYWPDGRFRCLVADPSSFTEGTKGLDLAVDSGDKIFVLDPEKNQVRCFIALDNTGK
jgi:hypothetical protein